MILLYNATETAFDNNGIGSLADVVSCVVTEERNGIYELEMVYPMTGKHYSDIVYRSIIYTKPNPFDAPQPFRVYRITRPLNGLVTVYAWHISYDLNGIPVHPFHTYTLGGALSALQTNALLSNNFTYSTDRDTLTAGELNIAAPLTVRNILGGVEGSLLDVFHGEYKFDVFNVAFLSARGVDNGVTLRYGKNIIALEQDEDFTRHYTGVAPYWVGEGYTKTITGYVVLAEGAFDYERIMPLDLTMDFMEEPTEAQMIAKAQSYIESNSLAVPTASVTIDYAMDATIETVHLCDTVKCYYTDLGVQVTAKCVKTEFDAILCRYRSITLGAIKSNVADSYAAQTANIINRIQSIEANYTTDGVVREIAEETITQNTSILQQAESIIASALEDYVKTTDYDTFRSSLETQFTILAGQIEASFVSTADQISTLSGLTEESFNSIYSFIRLLATTTDQYGNITQQGGIVLGESSSDIKLKLENDVLYFFTGNESIVSEPLAYFSAGKLYVNESQIKIISIGDSNGMMHFSVVGSGALQCLFLSPRRVD